MATVGGSRRYGRFRQLPDAARSRYLLTGPAIAREFSRPIKLLVAAQPTRGLDVGSIEYIHRRLIQKRDEGVAVLLVSVELDEIMALSDRIAVMYEGKIVSTVEATEVTREELGLLMAGAQLEGSAHSDAPDSDAKGGTTVD